MANDGGGVPGGRKCIKDLIDWCLSNQLSIVIEYYVPSMMMLGFTPATTRLGAGRTLR